MKTVLHRKQMKSYGSRGESMDEKLCEGLDMRKRCGEVTLVRHKFLGWYGSIIKNLRGMKNVFNRSLDITRHMQPKVRISRLVEV